MWKSHFDHSVAMFGIMCPIPPCSAEFSAFYEHFCRFLKFLTLVFQKVFPNYLRFAYVWHHGLCLASWFNHDHDHTNFLHFIRIFWYFYWLIWLEFPKMEISINCVALVSGFLNVVIWQYLVLISLRYSQIDFQGQISKKGNQKCNVHFVIQWRVSRNGNSALQPCHFGKCLLTVDGDE